MFWSVDSARRRLTSLTLSLWPGTLAGSATSPQMGVPSPSTWRCQPETSRS
jgi:hypothetical protein